MAQPEPPDDVLSTQSGAGGGAAARPVSPAAVARVGRRMQAAEAPPWLHGEIARRMAERLSVIRLKPSTVVDWDAFIGGSEQALKQAYPNARRIAVEGRPAMTASTSASATAAIASSTRAISGSGFTAAPAAAPAVPWWSARRWQPADPPPVTGAELPPGAGQLLWANMSLHRALDPQRTVAQWHHAVAVDGFLMFSTLGPGSLTDLRALYGREGWPPAFAPFVDMHDLGDMLVAAGFADPVMDQESITLTWSSAEALLAELRTLGGNVYPRRYAGLRTPRWRQRLLERLHEGAAADGRLGLTFEIVYGHAFRPLPRPRVTARTEVPLDDLRTMARAARRVR